jgi:MFS family permease
MRRFWPQGGLWRQPEFLKLWSGQTISEFGSQISALAIPFVAIKVLDASAFEVAALGTVEFLPFILFTLPAGVWVDRLPRRMVLIVGDVGRAGLLLSIPVAYATDALTLAQLYVVGFLVGILTVFFDVAYQSYLPSLVDREDLVEGNSKLQMTASGSSIAGPGVSGVLIGILTAPYAILVDALSFLVSGGFLTAIRVRETKPAPQPGQSKPALWPELKAGLDYVVKHPYLRPQAMCTGTSNFFSSLAFSIYLVYAVRELELSAFAIGLAFGLGNIGWLAGAAFSGRLGKRFGVGRTTLGAAFLFGPGMLLVPIAPKEFPLPFLIASGIIVGFGSVVYNIQQVSLRQAITPKRMQGRMNATMRFLVWGTMPLGSLAGGVLGSTVGLRETLIIAGVGGLLAILPIALSPLRTLERIPESGELLGAAVAAGEGGLVGAAAAGVDSTGAQAGTAAASVD